MTRSKVVSSKGGMLCAQIAGRQRWWCRPRADLKVLTGPQSRPISADSAYVNNETLKALGFQKGRGLRAIIEIGSPDRRTALRLLRSGNSRGVRKGEILLSYDTLSVLGLHGKRPEV